MKKNTFKLGGPSFWLPPKILMIMKLIVILLFASLMQVSAASFAQKITLKERDASLSTVLEKIRKQTGFDFIYDARHLTGAEKVSVDIANTELKDALSLIFSSQRLDFLIKDRFIVLTPKSQNKNFADFGNLQAISVRGRVLDENGKPLQGVNVKVKGTPTSVVTDSLGIFYIRSIDENSVLQISFLGYKLLEVVARANMGDIKMEVLTSELSEVTVATGYQKISKERFVGSYSQLDSAAYARRTGVNILDRLDGTVTGLLKDKKGGLSDAAAIQVRGASTYSIYTSKLPLIILDDFPYSGDINLINQNDVESITVLKDAAAAAVWGARAANGVIVITTKRGRYNSPAKVSISSNAIITERPDLFYNPKMSSADFIGAERFLFNNGFYDNTINNTARNQASLSPVVELLVKARTTPSLAGQVEASIAQLASYDLRNDLNKYYYQSAVSQQHHLNISGGNSSLIYRFSVGFNNIGSNIQNAKNDSQYTLSSNMTYRAAKNLEFSVGLNFSQGIRRNSSASMGNSYPYMQLADPQGNSLPITRSIRQTFIDSFTSGQLLDWNYRPLDEVKNADNSNQVRLLLLNLGAKYSITPWLSANFSYQINSTTGYTRNFYSPESFFARDLINRYTNLAQSDPNLRNPIPIGGILDINNSLSNYNQGRAQLNFDRGWGQKNRLTAFVSGDISQVKTSGDGSRTYGYDVSYGNYNNILNYLTRFPQINAPTTTVAIPNPFGPTEFNTSRLLSLASNVGYTYQNRYTIYASARRDGANVFGATTNGKWKPLWSLGASWEVHKEPFFKVSWVDNLRFKASYGRTGNIAENASALTTIGYATSVDALTSLAYARLRNPPNPSLRWEQVATTNIGLEFSLLKQRLNGSLELFQKKSTDILTTVPVDPTVGMISATLNAGNMKGHGLELNLASLNTNGAVAWRTNFGLSYIKTIVTKVNNGNFRAADFIAYGLSPAEGMLAYSISSYKFTGLDPNTGDPLGILNGQVSKDYSAIFQDSIGHQIYHGSAIPIYAGFIGNSIKWKNFTFSANITYRLDFYYRRPTINYATLASNGDKHADYENRWKKPGDEQFTKIPSFTYPLNSNRDAFYAASEANVFRGDNFRLQDVRMEYNFSSKKPILGAIKNLNAFFYLNNLNIIIWRMDKSTLDPDYSGGNDPSSYPTSKTYSFGLIANF